MKIRTHAPAKQNRPAAIAATPQPSRRFQTRAFPQPNTATGQPTVQARQQSESMGQLLNITLLSSAQPAGATPAVQAKLTIGQPNNKYEQAADLTAAQVVATPDTAIQRESIPEEEETLQTKPQFQRQETLEEEDLQMKPQLQREAMSEEDEELQTKPQQLQREAMPEEEEALQTKASGNSGIQRMDNLEEEGLQMKPIASIQREEMPEEDELQTKPIANTLQREEIPEEEEVQTKTLGSIQRKEMPEEEELQTKAITGTLQREEMPEEEEPLQMKRSPNGRLEAEGAIETQLNNSKGGGSPGSTSSAGWRKKV